ncbi:zinc finger BED domain-containing protein 5-like [Octopus sinensis]|uniref:Zinc finger BED domain-containing protein 5-like n=1 Tax=Octopus sinensis TaxID=2607531 RepID=A0A6P7U4U5_9MOLL|nr:zinc finger BED domain-containing protein 5-like [Octopus sinensis]
MHFSLRDKKSSYFKNMLKSQETQSATFVKHFTFLRALEASYLVAELISKNRKNHTIGEKLILPACKIIVSKILGEEATKQIDNIPLSNSTISRRLQDISENIEKFVNGKLIHSNFSIQVDESTDFCSESHVIVFVRFVNDNAIEEHFLGCKQINCTTKGEDIFNLVSTYFEQNNISWKNCVGICTDGAPSMVGSRICRFCKTGK